MNINNYIKKTVNIIIFLSMVLSFNAFSANGLSFLGDNINITQKTTPFNVDEAFRSEVNDLGENLEIILDIEPEHYLYKDKIKISFNDKQQELKLKDGTMVYDKFYGNSEVYEYGFGFLIPKSFSEETKVTLSYQGCSRAFDFCYPVKNKDYVFSGNKNYNPIEKESIKNQEKEDKIKKENYSLAKISDLASTNDTTKIVDLIKNNKDTFFIYLIFILIGVFVAFTPCIYPLMPIIIASTHNTKNKKLSTIFYIMGMVFSYSLIGFVVGLFDLNLQIYFQNKYFIYFIALFLFLLALYMAGFINFILSSKLNEKLTNKMNKINGDKYYNQFFIGFLSSLILSPCSVAPLLGVLIFIGQIGNPFLGMVLLGCMALGMGLPLFVLATSFSKIMPKNGIWMQEVKNIFSLLMIFISVYLIKFSISDFYFYAICSFLIIVYGMHLLSLNLKKKIGLILIIFSTLFIFNQSLGELKSVNYKEDIRLEYKEVNTLSELNKLIKEVEKPIFIDYYADWCVTCVRMENTVFKDYKVIKMLNNNYFMIKINLTEIDKEKQEIMDEKKIFGIPYYTFIDSNKTERVFTGGFKTDDFYNLLNEIAGK